MMSVLFVCWGNRCRSPMAEAALGLAARRAGTRIAGSSAGINPLTLGGRADYRAQRVARRHGADLSAHRIRKISQDDFQRHALILAMDRRNLDDLRAMAPEETASRVCLLLDLVPGREGRSVADPYHGTMDDFERAWRQMATAAEHLVGEYSRVTDC